jgi:hypothetical protein
MTMNLSPGEIVNGAVGILIATAIARTGQVVVRWIKTVDRRLERLEQAMTTYMSDRHAAGSVRPGAYREFPR